MNKNETWRSLVPRLSMKYPKVVLGVILILTLLFAAMFPMVQIDTDPENMLPENHEVRVTNDQIKDSFFLYDMVAIAIDFPESNPQLRPRDLQLVYELVDLLRETEGVVGEDILSFYTTDDIEGFPGGINVDRLLRTPPENPDVVKKLEERIADHPVLESMIYNPESSAVALYVPVEEKAYSYDVRQAVESFWNERSGKAGNIHVSGLPVAEESFGVEMFYQMGLTAPLAFILIGLLMLWFFRSVSMVVWSLVLSMVTVIWIMGSLIGLGFPVHIMSSMIPIFLLPIGVVDSVHVLSDFTDRYAEGGDREKIMADVFEELFMPILFTSVTSAVGFISLTLTGIPPVRIFGAAVGAGILLAFLMTLTVLPAGMSLWEPSPRTSSSDSRIGKLVALNAGFVQRWKKGLLTAGVILLFGGLAGMSFIQINDNPTKWFLEGHPIRTADHFFNNNFAGSYPAYWVLAADKGFWHKPKNLHELRNVLSDLEKEPVLGKTTSLADLVNKIHRELNNNEVNDPFPDTPMAVTQYLFLYENSGKPEDLYRLVNQDGSKINIWFNLKKGDNKDMAMIKERAGEQLSAAKFTGPVTESWGGITYVNLIWQGVMVSGMAWALATAYLVVFIMLWVLFGKIRWALVGLVPLTITLVVLYGGIGWIGKDYDMPVAVLSALSLGIAVDFAIHFIQRTRQFLHYHGNGWPEIREKVAGEPARAIARNAVVIAVGFIPLVISPLRPYLTVGVFMFLIMAVSGITTLVGLTAIMEQFHHKLTEK